MAKKTQPTRFAHPFFTNTPVKNRPATPQGKQMLDHIQGTLNPIPPLKGNGWLTLADVIGQAGSDEIQKAGQIILHIAGDTGVTEGDTETRQVMVADAMTKDYNPDQPGSSPAFLLHVGDVIYGSSTTAFLDQFYRPYIHYPGKIVAVPGNHDGETSVKMQAFQKYFCAPNQAVPPIAGSIYRETMNLPGVYWCLDAPFVQIVGLYSNTAENPGFISGPTIGQDQKNWLVKTLKTIQSQRAKGAKKALLIVTHHPPYSSGGHSGSTQMLADIDDACKQAGIMPDAFLSGHAHSLQRYTRSFPFGGKTMQIPYIVSGCGGHGGQAVPSANSHSGANPSFDFSYKGWGYTKAVISSTSIAFASYGVDWNTINQVDATTVSL